ncbi:MAG: Tetratricopeptide repeat protein [Bacteriovoracaceae bacterium]|nr:Tetratricopeptide repeat protein [Bacteriovoracaceae bacterium]
MELKELQSEITHARNLFKAKQYDKAEELFVRILKKHKLADVYNYLGLLYSDNGKFNFAEMAFKRALQINPSYMEAALNLVVLYNNLGLRKKSKVIYEQLQKYGKSGRGAMDPLLMAKVANLHAEVGGLYQSVGHYKDAVSEYEKAIDLCPQFIDVQTKLAICCRENGDLKKALRIFAKSKSRAGSYAPYWIALGVTHYARGKGADAKKAWDKALKIEPKNKVALAYRTLTMKN